MFKKFDEVILISSETGRKKPSTSRRGGFENGAIAQLGERLHGMQEVSGSIPLGSTNLRFV
jgi:hypothetical protein